MSLTLNAVPNHQQQIESLQRELYARNRQLADAQEALRQEQNKSAAVARGVGELRQVLTPLYRALGQVFGEIDSMGTSEPSGADPRKSAIWESWKKKLPSGEGRAIDALLLHGSMTTGQLRIHVGCASRTAQNIVTALRSKGLITKDGAQIRLKEL
jgi:hypothetical protein